MVGEFYTVFQHLVKVQQGSTISAEIVIED